uniref:Uncharacterized protein n=1 Tax=Palpitomonas bilix TaxID=652834 RepID=A0A7S3D6W4_9EUKA
MRASNKGALTMSTTIVVVPVTPPSSILSTSSSIPLPFSLPTSMPVPFSVLMSIPLPSITSITPATFIPILTPLIAIVSPTAFIMPTSATVPRPPLSVIFTIASIVVILSTSITIAVMLSR